MIHMTGYGNVRIWETTSVFLDTPSNIVIHMSLDELLTYASEKGFDVFLDDGTYMIFLTDMVLCCVNENYVSEEDLSAVMPV